MLIDLGKQRGVWIARRALAFLIVGACVLSFAWGFLIAEAIRSH